MSVNIIANRLDDPCTEDEIACASDAPHDTYYKLFACQSVHTASYVKHPATRSYGVYAVIWQYQPCTNKGAIAMAYV